MYNKTIVIRTQCLYKFDVITSSLEFYGAHNNRMQFSDKDIQAGAAYAVNRVMRVALKPSRKERLREKRGVPMWCIKMGELSRCIKPSNGCPLVVESIITGCRRPMV